MAPVPLCCLSSDCPTVIVQHELWQWWRKWWRAAGGYMAPLCGLWPREQNNGANTVGFQAAFPQPSQRGTLKEADSERHQRQAAQRGIVKVRDLLAHLWCLMTHSTVGLQQEKHANIHSSTAGVQGTVSSTLKHQQEADSFGVIPPELKGSKGRLLWSIYFKLMFNCHTGKNS